ncbi:MAG: FAD/NAD(P)-binding protein [Deltaproteobacteria bacterium]|nr:FAD/NAD(P)-binding protein [Deltaproteobacteria bacterium]
MHNRNISVAIIGAGASGTILAYQIMEKASQRSDSGVKVYLIEKDGDHGPGLAYKTPLSAHILNMRADTLGVLNGDPLDFVRWLKGHDDVSKASWGDLNYPPRNVYGRYLDTVLDLAVKKAALGSSSIELITGEAVDIDKNGRAFSVKMSDGGVINANSVILAPGNFPGAFLSELNGTKGYFPYPWPVSEIIENIPMDQPVCIMGAGLSAIDTLITLLENGHREKITFLSRNGLLPKVQGAAFDYQLKYVNKETIDRFLSESDKNSISFDLVKRLYMDEMEAAAGNKINWLDIFNPQESATRILEKDISRAEAGVISYQAALTASGPLTGYIWNSMSIDDRMRFDREYKTVWAVYRHPMPVINAKKILNTLKSGQLDIQQGRTSVKAGSKGGFEIDVITRLGVPFVLKTPYIINATGQEIDVTKFESKLIKRLINKGLIIAHPNGGIFVDFCTSCVKEKSGKDIHGLYALGEITRGVHFFTNGIVPNMVSSGRIADAILA